MHFSLTSTVGIVATAFTSLASATCLLDSQANNIANAFGSLVSNYNNDTANALFIQAFIDYSESINSVKNGACSGPIDLTGLSFSSRLDFETQSAAQPQVPFAVQQVWHTCDVITVRWKSAQSPQPVVGISVFETVWAPTKKYGFQIKEIFAEFDSAAWMANLGIIKPTCASKREEKFIARARTLA
jgi:hypothetical protein